MRLLLLACSLTLCVASAAQTRGTCAPGTASSLLDDGDVRATLYNGGNLFYGSAPDEMEYVVPAASGVSAIYAASLWLSGTVGGDLRTAGATYGGFAFYPGPLDASAPPPTDCSAFDRIWVVSLADIATYEATGVPTPDLATWPVALGAEAVDGDGDPANYDLAAGDRPRLYGTQTAFWVMNDAAGAAGALATEAPIGVEVQVTASAFNSPDPVLRTATAYRFRLIKRTPGLLETVHAALFVDPDLGNASDDYAGVDSTRGMAFVYNADNLDEAGYGTAPPAVGYDWLTGASSHVVIGRGSGTPRGDAFLAEHLRHYSLGAWRDGTPVREGGTGLDAPGPTTVWTFAGDPVAGLFWSERNIDGAGASLPAGDVKQAVATGPFSLTPGVPYDLVLAIPYGRGSNHLDSVTQLRAASDALQAAHDAGTLFPVANEGGAPSARTLALAAPRPNPTTGDAEVALTMPDAADVRVRVVDVLGRTVAAVHDGPLAAGATVLRLPAGLAPGVYTVVAEAGDARAVRRLTIAR